MSCTMAAPAHESASMQDDKADNGKTSVATMAQKKGARDGFRAIPVNITLWEPDLSKCNVCDVKFTIFNHRHMCRKCQEPVCNPCARGRKVLRAHAPPKRVCDTCVDNYWGAGRKRTASVDVVTKSGDRRLSLTVSASDADLCPVAATRTAPLSPGTPAGFFGGDTPITNPSRRHVSLSIPDLPLASPAMLPPPTPASCSDAAATTPLSAAAAAGGGAGGGWNSFFGGRPNNANDGCAEVVVEETQERAPPSFLPAMLPVQEEEETPLASPAAVAFQEEAEVEEEQQEASIVSEQGEAEANSDEAEVAEAKEEEGYDEPSSDQHEVPEQEETVTEELQEIDVVVMAEEEKEADAEIEAEAYKMPEEQTEAGEGELQEIEVEEAKGGVRADAHKAESGGGGGSGRGGKKGRMMKVFSPTLRWGLLGAGVGFAISLLLRSAVGMIYFY